MKVSVIIPTYKNKDILLENLADNLIFLKNCEIIVVNDDPEKSLKEDLKKFKNVILLENKKNLGFGLSVNEGVKSAKGEYIMLLNNDAKLRDDSFKSGLLHFKKRDDLFAVSFAQIEKDGRVVGKNKVYWHKGLFQHKGISDNTFGETGWAEGGTCLIDKEKFNKIRGFSPIYSPFYWEDVDLSYRARSQGYEIIFEPKIEVIHYHESTIGKYYSKDFIKKVAFRNQLIFTWKNLGNPFRMFNHLFYLAYFLLRYTIEGKKEYLLGFRDAINLYFRNE